MLRRAFLRRMALAAAACAFIDVPWPKGLQVGDVVEIRDSLDERGWTSRWRINGGEWHEEHGRLSADGRNYIVEFNNAAPLFVDDVIEVDYRWPTLIEA